MKCIADVYIANIPGAQVIRLPSGPIRGLQVDDRAGTLRLAIETDTEDAPVDRTFVAAKGNMIVSDQFGFAAVAYDQYFTPVSLWEIQQ